METFLAGVLFVPPMGDPFGLPKLVVLAVGSCLVVTLWCGARPASARPSGVVVALVGAGLAWTALAAAMSVCRVCSVMGTYQRYGGLITELVCVLAGLAAWAVATSRPVDVRQVGLVLAVAGAAAAAYVLFQTAGLDVFQWRDALGHPVTFQAGPLGNPDFAGAFIGVSWPGWWFLDRKWLRAPFLAVEAAALVATGSRGGVVAAGASGLVLVLTAAPALRDRWRHPWLIAAAGAIGGALLMAAAVVLVPPVRTAVRRADPLRTVSAGNRLEEWKGAVTIAVHHPIIGTGPDTFGLEFPAVRSRRDGARLGNVIADKPHNIFLERAAGTGFIGLGLFVALLVAVIHQAWRRREAAVWLAVLAGYLAQGFFSIDTPALLLAGWTSLGVLAALASRPPVERAQRGRRRSEPRRMPAWPAGLAAAGTVAVVGLAAVAVAADASAGRAERARSSAIGVTAWNRAIRLNPNESAYRLGSGLALELHDLDAARAAYLRALDLAPGSVPALLALARADSRAAAAGDLGGFAAADRWYDELIRRDPQDWEVHDARAVLLNAWSNATAGDPGPRREAALEFEAELRIRPDRVPAWLNLARVRQALGDRAGMLAAARRALALDPNNVEASELVRSAQS